MALATLVVVGCEKEDDNYSTDFSGMWAGVGYYEDGDRESYDLVEEVLSFEKGYVKSYVTRNYSGYTFKNGYLDCLRSDLYASTTFEIELHKDKCYMYDCPPGYSREEVGYLKIKGDKMYWYDGVNSYEIYERIKGFTED